MQKILIIKLGALADFVLDIGAMMSIRHRFPEAELTLMTNSAFLRIARQMGIFAGYIIDNRPSYLNLPQQIRLLRRVTEGNFDYIFDLQCSGRTEKRYFPVFRWFAQHSFCWVRCHRQSCWRVEKTRSWTRGRLTAEPCATELPPSDLSFLHGANRYFHKLPERFVVLIPGGAPHQLYKRWPIARYCELAQRLAERGIASVLIGSPAETEQFTPIIAASPMVVNMLGKTSLLDIPDLARQALAIVGNATGPTHMASLSGSPTIGIYAQRSAHAALRGPRSACLISPADIDQISLDQVWEKLEPLLP